MFLFFYFTLLFIFISLIFFATPGRSSAGDCALRELETSDHGCRTAGSRTGVRVFPFVVHRWWYEIFLYGCQSVDTDGRVLAADKRIRLTHGWVIVRTDEINFTWCSQRATETTKTCVLRFCPFFRVFIFAHCMSLVYRGGGGGGGLLIHHDRRILTTRFAREYPPAQHRPDPRPA